MCSGIFGFGAEVTARNIEGPQKGKRPRTRQRAATEEAGG